MSIEHAAGLVAERLAESEFVHVFGHHDADGIAAASVICHSLLRSNIPFQLRFRDWISVEDIAGEGDTLLCDFGSSLAALPDSVMVIDHHVPHFEGEYHVNPRLFQIDGDKELSAAGAAYLVAQQMGDFRDLAGIALLGMIGDRQSHTGMNGEIFNDGMANGFISPMQGLRLPGRSREEQLLCAIHPYLSGISGDKEAVSQMLEVSRDGEGGEDCETLLSYLLLKVSPLSSLAAMTSVYGDMYLVGREVLEDAFSLAAIIDACGKAGSGDLGAALCLRSPLFLEDAWETTRTYRRRVIGAIGSAREVKEDPAVYEIEDHGVAGDVADAFAFDFVRSVPVFVTAQTGDICTISGRCPPGAGTDLEDLMRRSAIACGGDGGGHRSRAGARIPAGQRDRCVSMLVEATAA